MEGYRIPDNQIQAEYNALYRPEPTPITHPELYDPLRPPPGWAYDAWHAVWYKDGVSSESMSEIRLAGWILAGFFVSFSVYVIIMLMGI